MMQCHRGKIWSTLTPDIRHNHYTHALTHILYIRFIDDTVEKGKVGMLTMMEESERTGLHKGIYHFRRLYLLKTVLIVLD